ncbi:hypothetical protein, partial [Escherichia coli]|uniref:hypothetical protein n=1 Tax=Escherichia coli TaxID=562 RepID=UPI0038548C74
MVLVTTRVRVANIPGQPAWISVPPLERDDAVTLMANRSGQPRERVLRLAERGAGMPLALRSLADYVAT